MSFDRERKYLANKIFDYFLLSNIYCSCPSEKNIYKKLLDLGYAFKKKPTPDEKYDVFRNFLIGKGLITQIKTHHVHTYKRVKTKLTPEDANNFYKSWEWKRVRYQVLLERGKKCEVCGVTNETARLVVDHIKPLRLYPELALVKSNLQVLCDDCNRGKSNF